MSHGVGIFFLSTFCTNPKSPPSRGELLEAKSSDLTTDELNPTLAFDQSVVVVMIITEMLNLLFGSLCGNPF